MRSERESRGYSGVALGEALGLEREEVHGPGGPGSLVRSGHLKDGIGMWTVKPECGKMSRHRTVCHATGKQAPLARLMAAFQMSALNRLIRSPCRDQPSDRVPSIEFGSIVTGQPPPLRECGTWGMEWEVLGGSLLSTSFQVPLSFT